MPRVSLKQREIDVLLQLVSNSMIALGDDLHHAQNNHDEDWDDGEIERIEGAQRQMDALATKLVTAKASR